MGSFECLPSIHKTLLAVGLANDTPNLI